MYHFCTYFDHRYLPQGLALYHSLRQHCQSFHLWVLCLSEPCFDLLSSLELPNIGLINLEQLEHNNPELLKAKGNRSVIEYYFTCTPQLASFVLKQNLDINLITYLDADLFFYNDPAITFQEIGSRSVAIIGHKFPPHLKHHELYGVYNVGWVSFRRDEDGLACLNDWKNKCLAWCYDRVEEGRFADQKYLDYWQSDFNNVIALQHKGANVAPWNVANYNLSIQNDQILVDNQPLVFYHFHGVKKKANHEFNLGFGEYNIQPSDILVNQVYLVYLRVLLEINELVSQIFEETHQDIRSQPTAFELENSLNSNSQLIITKNWLEISEENLEQVFQGDLGKRHQELVDSGFKNTIFSMEEKQFIVELNQYIAKGWKQDKITQHFLAASLYCYPHQLPEKWFENAEVPEFLVDYFVNFMFETPSFFKEINEVSQYYQYTKNWVDFIHLGITTESDSPLWQQLAWFFTQRANFISLYCSTENLKEIYVKRAEIMEIALKQKGFQLEHSFPPREKNRKKIRLGILSMHFVPQTETFATLPVFEYLDRSFEIILYSSKITNHPLEQYCESRADRLVQLPEDVQSQVAMLREDDLDILWMVNNVTAVTHNLTLLALHRLARLQVTSFCSPTTTGMRHVDYFIAGELSSDGHQEQFSEQLVNLKGSGICFNYATEYEPPTNEATKAKFGIPEDKVILVSGANFYKIIPELRETWAKILAAAPNTVLVLYPFGPAWSSSYPKEPFINTLYAALEKYGAAKEQLIILEQLPTRGDVKELLKLADIYLDSYPYSGATSLLDPLSIGLPMILMSGNALRFRQGVAMLNSIGLDDLIVQDEESYINLAVKLGMDEKLRNQYREQILEKMANNPPFLDSRSYSAQIGDVLKQLFKKHL